MQYERFDNYLLLEKLAAGGMAEVYLGKLISSQGINKFVAIKRILSQFSEHPEFIEMFREEAKIAANLRHSNIVSIHYFGFEKNQLFLVMDFVEGQNLRQTLNVLKKENRNLSIDQVVYLIKEIAAGLDYAHRALDDTSGKPLNIIHRDMSPQNVMISFDGEVKIVDFGIAKTENQIDQTQSGTIKGKFGYMSPEQADGKQLDGRTDVFSLGVILWELLSGERLFVAANEAATLKKVRDCQIPSLRKINPEIPAELERIAMKALTKDLSLRYQSAQSLHKDLNRFLNIHYPEFSKQEFSRLMKSVFHEMFLDNRKKLADYSKIVVSEPDSKGKEVTVTLTEDTGHTLKVGDEPIPGLDISINTSTKNVKLSSLRNTANTENSQVSMPHVMVPKTASYTPPSANDYQPYGAVQNKVNFQKKSNYMTPTLILVAGISLGYYVLNKKNENKSTANKHITEPQRVVASKAELPTKQKLTSVSIQSIPQGGVIEVNGQRLGITPYLGNLPSSQVTKIIIRKEGYVTFEHSQLIGEEPYRLEAALQAEAPKGYISIDLVGAPLDTVITVNGLRVNDKSQLSLYAVPAKTPIKIVAYSPFSNSEAKVQLQVGVNEKKQVKMILTRRAANE